jgi:parallel beta-helix repeat protein
MLPAGAADYFVATNGDDQATGTSTSFPWRTLTYSINQLAAGDTLYVRGGTYREWINATNTTGTAGSPILITAYSNETPVIKGSDIVTGWELDSGAIWKKTNWIYNSQQVFVDGSLLTQVGWPNDYVATNAFACTNYLYIPMGYSCADIDTNLHTIDIGDGLTNMVSGSFWYNKTNESLYVWLPDSSSPTNHFMEVSTRVGTYYGRGSNEFVHLRGLTMMHGSSMTYTHAGWPSVVLGENSTIEDCIIQWHDCKGISMADNCRILNCDISHHGIEGIRPAHCTNVLIQQCTVFSNNYRDFTLTYAAGIKVHPDSGVIVEGNEIAWNKSSGLWVDTCHSNFPVIFRNNYVHNNRPFARRAGDTGSRWTMGIFIEFSNETDVYGNLLLNNGPGGIGLSASEDCAIENNTIIGTQGVDTQGVAALRIYYSPPSPFTVSSNRIYNNLIYNNNDCRYDISAAEPDGSNVLAYVMNFNCIYRPGSNAVLTSGGTTYTNLGAWSAATGWDANSLEDDPMPANYRLTYSSPCIDAGTNQAWMSGATDLDGHPRILYGTVDIGAFEFFDLHITNITRAGDGTASTWPALTGLVYRLQCSTDMVNYAWNNVGNAVTADSDSVTFTWTNAAVYGSYRVREE